MSGQPPRPGLVPLLAAFAAVYLIWGSTYLAIKFVVETLPPFLAAGARWIPAGLILYAWSRSRGAPAATLRQWTNAGLVGLLLIVGGNGLVSWAEQTVPSNLTALIISTVPLWLVVFDWMRPGGVRPTLRTAVGIAIGLFGVFLLVGRAEGGDGGALNPWGVAAILTATITWAFGSLYSRRADMPKATLLSASIQMIVGGIALLVLGAGTGEVQRFDPAGLTTRAVLSWAFLAVFGSIVAFSAYVWLLQVSTPSLVGTYAFVNPVVAVILGWAFANEVLTTSSLVAAAFVVVAVAIIVTAKKPAPATPTGAGGPAPSGSATRKAAPEREP